MYLIDTNVVSELRKKQKINSGVKKFFKEVQNEGHSVFISVVTIGELRRGIDLIEYRGDTKQAKSLEKWLNTIVINYSDYLLGIEVEIAQLWGRLRVPHYENALDKFIAATALLHNLIIVIRNDKDFRTTGAKVLNPFR